MGDNTTIEWARHPETGRGATWNPITGCALVSEGCRNCYAARDAARRLKNHPSRIGLARVNAAGVAKFTGEVRFNDEWLDQPLRWRSPRGIFVCAHGDLFAEGVPDDWIDRVFAVMALCPDHRFFVLTKRATRMRDYVRSLPNRDDLVAATVNTGAGGWSVDQTRGSVMRLVRMPMPNVSLGVSVEDQATADDRRRWLAYVAGLGWTTFVSYEPALGPVEWAGWEFLDCLISGGESGSRARPSHPDWHRATREFAAASGAGYHFKQWGAWAPELVAATRKGAEAALYIERDGSTRPAARGARGEAVTVQRNDRKLTGRLLDDRTHDAMPVARPAQ